MINTRKGNGTHSSALAWEIPWTEEPGGLQCMGSRRVRHDWATSLSLFTFMQWRRKWQPTPVFLPGESQGQGSLVGCRLRGRTESDTTEVTQQQQQQQHDKNSYFLKQIPTLSTQKKKGKALWRIFKVIHLVKGKQELLTILDSE